MELTFVFAQFMCAYKMDPKKVGAYAEETFLPIRAPVSKFLKRQTKRGEGGEIVVSLRMPTQMERDTCWCRVISSLAPSIWE